MTVVAILFLAASLGSAGAEEAASAPAPQERSAAAGESETRAAGVVVNLTASYFTPGTFQVRSEAKARLAPVIGALHANPKNQVFVEGRVDGAGSQVENQQIALKQASSVRDLLTRQGVAADRIVVRGIGAAPPAAVPAPPRTGTRAAAIRASRTAKPPTTTVTPRTPGRVQVMVVEPKERTD